MISRADMHNWVMVRIKDAPLDAPEVTTRLMAFGAVDAYLTLGVQFDLFTSAEQQAIRDLLTKADQDRPST